MKIRKSQPEKCKPGENLYYPQYICQSLGSQNNGLISQLPKAQCSSLQQKRLI